MQRTIWDEMRRMQNQMDSLFDTFFDTGFKNQNLIEGPGTDAALTGFKQPASDVYETDGSVIAEFEMPGANKDDINIDVTEDGIEVSAQTQSEEKEEDAQRIIRNYSRIYRSFPSKVDANKAEAEYKNGVLKITAPRLQVQNKKKLQIK